MTVTVRIPTALRALTGGADEVASSGATVAEVIDDLEARFPGVRARLCDDRGLRRFVNVYVGEDDVRFLGGLAAPLGDGQTITIVPAVAGG